MRRIRPLVFLVLIFLLTFQGLLLAGDTGSFVLSDSIPHRIASITIIGNKTTRDHIILRELTFHTGDTLDEAGLIKRAHRSEENVYNTSLFNSVHINWLPDQGSWNVFILVTERWYIFPLPVFEVAERNFNAWWETKDYSRIIYGGILNWNNFRGRNELLATSVRLGYTQRVSFYYNIPYINKNQKSGITLGFFYSRNHQSAYKTEGNKILYYKNDDNYAKRETGAYVQYIFRQKLYESHFIELGYRDCEVLDTILQLNPEYFAEDKPSQKYLTFRYFFKSDHRDIAFYPLKGHYFDFEFIRNGFYLTKDPVHMAYITTHYNRYWKLGGPFHYSAGAGIKYSGSGETPYYNIRGLGYGRDAMRGYEYYVMDGENYLILKNNLKFTLLRQHEVKASFIPLSKFSTIPYAFYLNLYSDIGYVRDKEFGAGNPLVNNWQYSFGTGIDFVTYYDMVFRLEYSVNKLGESGIFLHFTTSI